MKKKLAILLTLALMITGIFAGCGSKGADSDAVKIGLVQLMEHPSLDQIRESIIAELEAEGYVDGENIVIDYQNAQNEQSNLKTICQGFVADDVDMIVAITTPAAQVAMGETTDTPIIFAGVTDPIAAGLVEDLDNPGGNITGTSDAISVEQIMELAQEITPGFKTVGALYNSSEINSVATVDTLKKYAEDNNLQVEEAAITSTNEIQQAAQNLSKKCDIVFSPTDNTVASAIASANQVFIEAKIPFYVGADSMVKDGALATLGVNYEYLGQETARMMIEVINGEEPGKMAVRTMKETGICINSQTASDMGITIPKTVVKKAKDMATEEL